MVAIYNGTQQYNAPNDPDARSSARNDAAIDVAITFLRRFHPAGPWALATFGSDNQVGPARTFAPSDEAAVRRFLSKVQGKYNVYFAVNPIIGKLNKKASRADVAEIHYLHVDADLHKALNWSDPTAVAAEKGRVLAQLQSYDPPPTAINWSGGGYQGFWRLAEHIVVNGEAELMLPAERRMHRIEQAFGADACSNADRVMRLPGTINVLGKTKIAAGRKPALAEIVEFHEDRLSDIEDFPEPYEPQARVNGAAHSGDSFYRCVNDAALARRDDWVPDLHPTARKEPNGTWRVTSKNLGRDLEEDLAYHANGIRDHGEEHGLTPIDAVLRYGDVADTKAAAMWLCQKLGIEPARLGWKGGQGDAGTSTGGKQKNDGARPTQAQTLIDIATGDGVDLYHSPDGTTYADIIVNGHRETWPTKSSGFKGWLRRTYYEQTGGAPNSDAMSTAMGVIDARAHFDGVTRHVYIRVASRTTLQGDEFIYIDRGDDTWEAIEVDGEGWRAIKAPPVRFRRAPGMLALPSPLLGGNISELRKHLNLSDDAFVLSVGWLLSALRGRGPYPILLLNGEQGAGKSTAADRLRRLVDPHAAPLRGLPRDVRDLAIAANNAHILAFDNLSGISADIADALCRLSTGGGFATRALYSDDEERFFDGMRPIVMNSIVDIATRPDLSDRGLVAVLEAIAANERKTEREVRDAFDKAAPHILGALLDTVALGLKRESSVRLNRLPRMADHAVWVRACEPLDTQVGEQPWREGLHLDVYDRNRDEAAEIVLEFDLVAMALRKHMDMRPESTTTSTDLLKTLGDLDPEHVRRSKDWPPNARALSGRLRRLAPALRGIGIVMSFGREGHDRRRLITIKKLEVQDAFQE